MKSFLKDDDEITIQFYGGEPLLKMDLIEEIMDKIPNVKQWSVQTNATKLHKIKDYYLKRFDSILVSIDGRREITDTNRGKGIYDLVLKECNYIRKRGYKGDLIARMAISEVADICEEITHLASLRNPHFDHIHWQLDSQWDDTPNARWKNFNAWVYNSYNPGISKLVDWWLSKLEEGKVVGLVPFLPILKSLIFNVPSQLRCGAGNDSFAINPNGTISVCPISPEFEFSIIGDIKLNSSQSIRNSMFVGNPCPKCDIYSVCGGRCLFINKTKLWGEIGFNKVCGTVKHLVSELKRIKQLVQELIEKGIIKKEEFDYPLYNNGCEIIP